MKLQTLLDKYVSAIGDAHMIEISYPNQGRNIAVNQDAYAREWQGLDGRARGYYEQIRERIAALEAENAKLRDPWVRIDPERPETLPPYTEYTKILITQLVEGKPTSKQGYYDGLQFRQANGSFLPLSLVVAWQPWPEPAPYEKESE